MDVVIIVSVSIMPLINISTIAHFINDMEAEESSGRCPNDRPTSQLISELSKHLSAAAMRLLCILIQLNLHSVLLSPLLISFPS